MNGAIEGSVLRSSPSIAAISKAVLEAQRNMDAVRKSATNAHFNNKYASLEDVIAAVQPALQAAGIAAIQCPGGDGERVSVETTLVHESGEWLSSTLTLRPTKCDPQGAGSAITYARRYALLAMCGIAPEDDDGNAASKPQSVESDTPRQARQPRQQRQQRVDAPAAYKAYLAHFRLADVPQNAADFRIWARGLTPSQVMQRLQEEDANARPVSDSAADTEHETAEQREERRRKYMFVLHGKLGHSDADRRMVYERLVGKVSASQLDYPNDVEAVIDDLEHQQQMGLAV